MTSKITFMSIMLAMICLCTSCLSSNDDEIITYDDTAITSFKLGNVKCYRTVKGSQGQDSTYYYTYSAATTPIYIDQLNRRIYNEDSLVVGTDLSRVLTTITTKNSGFVQIKNLEDEQWTNYSSADSIDWTQERTIRVISNSQKYDREYKVNIVCHKEHADSFSWQKMPVEATIATFTNIKTAVVDGTIYVLGTDNAGNASLLSTQDCTTWASCSLPNQAASYADASMIVVNDKLKMLVGGVLYTKTDAATWASVAPNMPLKTILGGVSNEFYAISTNGMILKSTDHGAQWAEEPLEDMTYIDNTSWLPVADMTLLTQPSKINNEVTYYTLVGNPTVNKDHAVVWTKVADPDMEQPWYYTTAPENKAFVLPLMQGLTAVRYADGIIATGMSADGVADKAYGEAYYSPDNGVTWHKNDVMTLPAEVKGAQTAALATDGKGYIYVIAVNGNAADKSLIYKGKLNKVLWTKPTQQFR